MTNADKIRGMTVEELAMLLQPTCPVTQCLDEKPHDCYKCWLNWLKQEITDNSNKSVSEIIKYTARPISELDLQQMDRVSQAVYNAIALLECTVVEVIRCKDCREYDVTGYDETPGFGWCGCLHKEVQNYFYCAHGEKGEKQ